MLIGQVCLSEMIVFMFAQIQIGNALVHSVNMGAVLEKLVGQHSAQSRIASRDKYFEIFYWQFTGAIHFEETILDEWIEQNMWTEEGKH